MLKQIIWYILGIFVVYKVIKIGNNKIYKYYKILYIIGILSLVSLLLFAKPINNSKCWFTVFGIGTIQPSEFMKIILIITNAVIIDKHNKSAYKKDYVLILKIIGVTLIPSILTFLQPDTGMVLIYFVISFVMLFTSGTTAMSKAVMLSHKNICSNLMDIATILKIDENDTLLSFLPLHHTFECTVGFLYVMYTISRGASIAYCEGIRHIASNIKEFEITAMISVPALYENIYKRVMKSIEKKGKLAEVEKIMKLSGMLSKVGIDLRKKMFKEIHESLGPKLRLMVNGGAALDYEVEKGFNELGFRIVQGYGLTETSPVIAAGTDFEQRIGSVGKVLPSLKVKIVNKDETGTGEVIVKGPSVMLGYYQNEEANKEVFEKGWLHTGDLGHIDKKGFLFLAGRKKSVIVLKNGIKESFIYGKPEDNNEDDLKLCAKVVYDKDLMKQIYNANTEEEIKNALWLKIKEINKTMPPYKYIKELIVSEEELIKTTTLKIKRHEELAKIEAK